MKILAGLEGTASAFAGQALEGLAIKRAARKWGIFIKEAPKQSGFWEKASAVVGDDVTSMFTKGPEMLLGASHVETLNVSKSSAISGAPQEDGSFMSYNKVQNPYQFEIRMICDGSDTGNMWENMLPGFVRDFMGDGPDALKKEFIKRLDEAALSTTLYIVSTPEKLYQHANIIGYRIHRGPNGSSDMLIADITLQEVRQAGVRQWTAKYPQGAKTKDIGTVQPQAKQ